MNNKAVNKYFDAHAPDYDSAYLAPRDLRSFIFNERKRIVLDMFDLTSGRVLDIGCGPAVYTDKLSASGYEIYGVDPSEKMVEIARDKNFKNAKFTVGDIEGLAFADNFFDGVLCVGVLEYLKGIDKGIKEAARVTRPGGIAVFTVPNGLSLLNRLELLLRKIIKISYKASKIGAIKSLIDYDYESRLISKKELTRALNKNGFKIEESRFHIFRLSFLNKISPRIALFIAQKMNFVSSPLLAVNYIVKCKKI